jgi:hypothetical protein
MDTKGLPPPPPLPPPPTTPPPKARGHKPVVPKLSPGEQASVRLQKALLAGFVVYLQNPGMSIVAVWETAAVSADDGSPLIRECIGLDAFQRSAAENKWAARRDQHWAEVRSRVESKLMDQHVQRTLADLTGIEALKTVAMQHITGDAAANIKPVAPRSLEGVMKAYIDLTKQAMDMRGLVVEQAADAARAKDGNTRDPQLPGAAASLILEDDGFSDADIDAMARAAALNASLGGAAVLAAQSKVIEAAPIVASKAKKQNDNEIPARPVMEAL